MATKRCGKCEKTKRVRDFHRKGKGYRSWCKACAKVYHREHYERNRSRYLKQAVIRKRELIERVREYKAGKPCEDCDQSFHPVAMDFDHVDGEKTAAVVSLAANGASWERILEEIAKCDLVCAVCHRIRTFERCA